MALTLCAEQEGEVASSAKVEETVAPCAGSLTLTPLAWDAEP
jgi:hypothetical protein